MLQFVVEFKVFDVAHQEFNRQESAKIEGISSTGPFDGPRKSSRLSPFESPHRPWKDEFGDGFVNSLIWLDLSNSITNPEFVSNR